MVGRPPPISPLDEHLLDELAAKVARRHGGMKIGALIVQLLAAAIVAFGTVKAAGLSNDSRVAVLESRVDDLKSAISEIRQDVKTLLSRQGGR